MTADVVDLAFPVTPARVPLDHGYLLYAALSKACPALHEAEWLGIHPLGGKRLGLGTLVLTRGSHVRLRLPIARIQEALPLSEARLTIAGQTLLLGTPTVRALRPFGSLFARQVVIRLTNPPATPSGELDMAAFEIAFTKEATRQLEKLGIQRTATMVARRVLSVGNQQIVGFSVQVDALSEEQSLTLQAGGLGGKRRMGCGIFRPARSTAQAPEVEA